jgi:hypothetical protein
MKRSKQEIYMDCIVWAQQYYTLKGNYPLNSKQVEAQQKAVLKVANKYYKEIMKKK